MVDVLLGLQWGDEGKGARTLDLIMRDDYPVTVRYNGGPNAGHSLDFGNGKTIAVHVTPSAATLGGIISLMGNDMVVDPYGFYTEARDILRILGVDITNNSFLSREAGIISPYQRLFDFIEESIAFEKIGTTGKGIAATYGGYRERKIVRACDVVDKDNFRIANQHMIQRMQTYAKNFDIPKILEGKNFDLEAEMVKYYHAIEWMRENIKIVDMNKKVQDLLRHRKTSKFLAEGAQGVLLDINHGDYPYVTSSNTCAFGVFNGLGIGHKQFGKLYGVTKPYNTKVGGGEFICEMSTDRELLFQRDGNEKGASTGRPRMCGYPDMVVLRHAITIHRGFGLMHIIVSKADIYPSELLDKPMLAVVAHKHRDGSISKELRLPLKDIVGVVTKEIAPWQAKYDLRTHNENDCKLFDNFLNFVYEELSDLPKNSFVIDIVGTGPQIGQYYKQPKR